MRTTIPKRLEGEFIAYMDAHDMDDLPDGAWLAVLTEAAEKFMANHRLRGDAHDAALEYVTHTMTPVQQEQT